MTIFFSPLVGSHFYPPAKLILAVLPANCPLILDPEPYNPYDSNAIEVYIDTSIIDVDENSPAFARLVEELPRYGSSIEDLVDGESRLKLGHVAAKLPKSMSAQTWAQEYVFNARFLEEMSCSPEYVALLAFAPDGSYLIKLDRDL